MDSQPAPVDPMKTEKAVIVFVLGLISMFGPGCLLGIPAWLLGNNVLREMGLGKADISQRGLAQAGRIFGIISTILTVIILLVYKPSK